MSDLDFLFLANQRTRGWRELYRRESQRLWRTTSMLCSLKAVEQVKQ